MKTRNLSQIFVLLLAVAISLYFWLGRYAFIVYGVVIAVVIPVYIWHRKAKKVEHRPCTDLAAVPKDISAQIAHRRKEQGRVLLALSEQIKAQAPEHNRMVERLLDWYLEYLRDNGIYHQDLYQYLLVRIKDRQKEAKAHYLRRELEQSKIVIRAIMRGEEAAKIVERLEFGENVDSQE